jgi:2-polyprenyl-6-methoxyphenol hydroxylase-like FAD-dependent oxidoreductase
MFPPHTAGALQILGPELIDADLPMPNHGHVILSRSPNPALPNRHARNPRAHRHPRPPALGGAFSRRREEPPPKRSPPNLPACVRPSFAAAIAQGRFRSMPNSFLPPSTQRTPGLILLGDAMNMRHPLTGGGMTVGFSDVLLLSKLLAPRRGRRWRTRRRWRGRCGRFIGGGRMARRLLIFLPWRCIVCLRRMVCWLRFLPLYLHPPLPIPHNPLFLLS